MACKPEIARMNGRLGGRPKGTIKKPRFSDYVTEDQVVSLIEKALEMANQGNESMIKFCLEQHLGKAIQPVDSNVTGELTIKFDESFKCNSTTNKEI